MPLKSGIEVVDEVRSIYSDFNKALLEEDWIEEPTFVFTTNIQSQGFTRLLEQCGVTHVLSKPVEYRQLKELLTK